MALSPDAKILMTYAAFRKTAEHPEGSPNLHAFDVETGNILDSRVHVATETWRPQWSLDSQLCVRMWKGDVQFYTDNKFEEKPTKLLTLKGMRYCSLTKSPRNRNVAVYTPSEKSKPATVYVYAWRDSTCVPVANKSFFRADTVSLHWSESGTSLLVLTATKMSDTSYYGEQILHFLTTAKSGDSATVPMPRKGPIHQVLWRPPQSPNESPSQEQFVICQGSLPSTITVFNIKCEKVASLGTGPWNQVYFNPHGTLLLAGGFGSLNGSCTVWDYGNQQRLTEFSAQNSTYLTWLPDGEHLVTAITTPRLRIDNGWTIWHYSGRPVAHEVVEKRQNPRPATVDIPAATEHELYQVLPRPVPPEMLCAAPKPSAPGGGKTDGDDSGKHLPTVKLEKPKAYVPPALRNRSVTATHAAAVSSGRSGVDLKSSSHIAFEGSAVNKKKGSGANGQQQPPPPQQLSADQANQKQINYLKKKLKEIEKLKEIQKNSQLENTQLEKISKEVAMRQELDQLQLL